jgi:hypothetical protein
MLDTENRGYRFSTWMCRSFAYSLMTACTLLAHPTGGGLFIRNFSLFFCSSLYCPLDFHLQFSTHILLGLLLTCFLWDCNVKTCLLSLPSVWPTHLHPLCNSPCSIHLYFRNVIFLLKILHKVSKTEAWLLQTPQSWKKWKWENWWDQTCI